MPGDRPHLESPVPRSISWEVSRYCELECGECRASSLPPTGEPELDRAEGMALLEAAAGAGAKEVVLTGPDPTLRPEFHDWIRAACGVGLTPILSPSATPVLSHGILRRARAAGLAGVRVNLDGSRSEIHEQGPGTPGSFGWSREAVASGVTLGMPVTLRTRLGRYNREDLPDLLELVLGLEVPEWRLVLTAALDRPGAALAGDAREVEDILRWLLRSCRELPLRVSAEEAPHLRRVARENAATDPVGPTREVAFVSAEGEVLPGPSLPLSAGNVRRASLADMIRDDPVFRAVGDPDRLRGRCGRCEHRADCGGARGRALARHGDYLAEDPACAYNPIMMGPGR